MAETERAPDPDLVASIYEAGVVPERWPDVLHSLALEAGAQAAALVSQRPGNLLFTASERYREGFTAFAANASRYDNPRPRRSLDVAPGGFSSDLELCSPEELAADPIYLDFLYPHGLAHTSGTAIPVPSGDLIIFDVAREPQAGPFSRADMQVLDSYRPHLARAALMATRLGLERARAAAAALEAIGLPAAVLAADGVVLAANPLFEALAPRVVFAAYGKVALADRNANVLLLEALNGVASDLGPAPRSIPVPAARDKPALVAHLVPLRREAHDILAAAASMLVVTVVSAPQFPMTELLHGLFDLTPAETRVAQALANGRALGDLAVQGGVSIETLRSQLKSVMGKTGTRRQVDLVRLLLAARPIGGAPEPPPGQSDPPSPDKATNR